MRATPVAASPNVIGIICVIGATLSFTTQDMAIKWLSGDYPLHQIVLVRASVGLAFTLGIFIPLEGAFGNLRTKRLGLHMLRGFMVVIANMTFFTGLASMSLGNATAIFFVAPLLITAFSVPFLGEKVGWRRWLAVLMGLAGVTVMIRPGSGTLAAVAFFPLMAAFAYALLQIMTRKLGITEKASVMAFYIQVTFVVVSAVIGLAIGDGRFADDVPEPFIVLTRAWVWPDSADMAVMFAIGCLSGVGGYLISQGYRMAEAGVVAPFEYVALPVAVFWSFTVFGDWPDAAAWIGIALITSAGLYTFMREMVQRRMNALERPLPRNR